MYTTIWFLHIRVHVYFPSTHTCTDGSYTDPLGELPQRPMTAARAKPADEDEFEGVELGDDLLPE